MTTAETIRDWATAMPDLGTAVWRLTAGPLEHKHTYHVVCPWSPDGQLLLMLQYQRDQQEASICVQEMTNGELREIGTTVSWNAHNAASQQWQGDQARILYEAELEDGVFTSVSVNPDGSDARTFQRRDMGVCLTTSPDGRWAYGGSPFGVLFPDDQVAPRDDKGLMRLNLETGDSEVVLSLEDAIQLLPDPAEAEPCHMYAKMMIPHRRTGRLMFNLANSVWDKAFDEPRIRTLITVNPDGSDPAYLGRSVHHPNWHPSEERVLVNVLDFNEQLRFGLYQGDGSGLLHYIPAVNGSGHPSFRPDGQWICTDKGRGDLAWISLSDAATGREFTAATYIPKPGDGYASFKAIKIRAAGESLLDSLARVNAHLPKPAQTHAHGSWSRDGSLYLFNADLGDGSQLYAIDIDRTLEAEGVSG